jgi:release factor glutamine methyltransferase
MGPSATTIRQLLKVTQEWFSKKDIPSARLDAEVLLAKVLALDRLGLYLDMDRPLTDPEIGQYRDWVRRRGQFEPVAYILGHKEFYGLDFEVNAGVLIPRPDTEHLVEIALEHLSAETPARVVDVCTGSGCVAVAIATHRPQIEFWATELDAQAYAVAQRNIEKHGLRQRIHCEQGDLLEPCMAMAPMDMVVGNPPYILSAAMNDLAPDVKKYEPELALVGPGSDGLDCHRRILEQAHHLVRLGGTVLLEIGYDQGESVQALNVSGWTFVELHYDLSGHPRVAQWRRED